MVVAETVKFVSGPVDIAVCSYSTMMSTSLARDSMKPGHFWQWLIVDPAARRQGIGTLLYNMARQFLREQKATEIEIEVRESSPTGLHFAQQRGFTVDKLSFESSLDLSHFDEAPFSSVIEEVEASGIHFFTMEDE